MHKHSVFNILNWKLIIILLSPIMIVFKYIISYYPYVIEKYYSNGINKPIRQLLSNISSIYPYSMGEILFFLLIIVLIIFIILLVAQVLKKSKWGITLINLLCFVSALYFLFMFLWGLNYNRVTLDKILGLEIKESSLEEVVALTEYLIEKGNAIRENVDEDVNGVMRVQGTYEDVINRSVIGYEKVSKDIHELDGKYGIPKKIILSRALCYTGITGIYMPYTGEANVNTNVPSIMFPSTVMHEMAHQRGFAREDEANYIAYQVCMAHPDNDFRYSGIILALIYTTNALAEIDPGALEELHKEYNDGVIRDLLDYKDFWDKYKGKANNIANNINNAYLKSNGEKQGTQSYGEMVDLLLAQRRKELKGNGN